MIRDFDSNLNGPELPDSDGPGFEFGLALGLLLSSLMIAAFFVLI